MLTPSENLKYANLVNFIKNLKQCRLCGCFMPLKTLLPGQKCPDWPPRWE